MDDAIAIQDLPDLHALGGVLTELGADAGAITAYAERWVCATDGFEPSPVCVLRPVVPVLHRIAEAFDDVRAGLQRELAGLAGDVGAALAGLEGADAAAAGGLAVPPRWQDGAR